jgi:phage recombination protein Bet
MSNLAVAEHKMLSIWEGKENLLQIKKLFAPKLTENEFIIFVEMGKSTGLNPFLKEIWAVKYKEGEPAQIFVGRDGYRKSAQRDKHYDYHTCDAVYSNDKYDVSNGDITHKYNLQDRGKLMGAYCLVQRKGSSRPTYVFAELTEYNTGFSVWKTKPATMIKKVAEAQALKAAFQELFAGTYSEFEEFEEPREGTPPPKSKGVQGLKEKLGMVKQEEETVDFDGETGEVIEAEVEIVEPESMGADTITFLIENSETMKELMEAMKHLKDLAPSDKKTVYALYKKKEAELKS